MKNIKLLDCTLRDGGFVNDWQFGRHAIYNIYTRLAASNLDIIEVGFLNSEYPFSLDASITPRSSDLPKIYDMKTPKNPLKVAMIILGECPIENVDDQKDSFVDGIRIVFKNTNIDEGLEFAAKVKAKGYKVFLQPASVTDYSEEQMHDLVLKANKLGPEALYIVDTYGLMHKDKVFFYFNIMDKYLNKEIAIGFHSHNNLQMSYSSAIDLVDIETDRTVILDSSLLGMGKGAGNLNTELMADYLNKYKGKNYDLLQILEIIDLEILKIKQLYTWGYTLNGFLAASNDCHPKYIKYLTDKKTLSIKSVNMILSRLEGIKTVFDKEQIEKLYLDFQSNEIEDKKTIEELKEKFSGRELLVLAPGATQNTQSDKIKKFIKEKKPIVISVNHNPENYKTDYYFVSNSKRYSQMAQFLEKNPDTLIIATSNITPANKPITYYFNYSQSLVEGDTVVISANATLMFFKNLIRMGVKKVNIAGFDGFEKDVKDNYAQSYLSYNTNEDTAIQNKLIAESVEKMSEQLEINFITTSHYTGNM